MSNMVKAQERIEKRVRMSEPLLKRIGVSVEQYERIVLNALIRVPKLADCTGHSLETAVVACVEAGLVPDGREAAIIPFKDTATLIPMIGGKLRLARQATPGLSVRARCVYRGDHWEHEDGLKPILRHRKTDDSSVDPKDIIAAYAIGRAPGAADPDWEVLYRPELDRYRARSRATSHSPWKSDYGEMAEKTVLGLLLKRYPWRAPSTPLPVAAEDDAATLGYDAEVLPEEPATEPEQRGEAQVVEVEPAREEPPPEPPPEKPKPRRAKQSRRAAPKPVPEPPPEPGYDAHGLPDDADGAPF